MVGDDAGERIQRLLAASEDLLGELDPDTVLDRLLRTARDVTGARYAALGILDERRQTLERFVTLGIGDAERLAIGEPPRGLGVLGVLIEDPAPLRLADVGRHPRSYGFPTGHPPMRSFLGVPVLIRGRAWGNLYLAEHPSGEFSQGDEDVVVVLANLAAIAIHNARLYHESETRRLELTRAVRGYRATQDVALAIGSDVELERVLELIVKRGRALVDARSLLILLRDGEHLEVAAGAGHLAATAPGRLAVAGTVWERVLAERRPERIPNLADHLRAPRDELGAADARAALLVPMVHRGAALGVLVALDKSAERGAFDGDDQAVLETFATSAATAVALATAVHGERLRRSLAAAEAERRRWARELHDETLQALAALRVLLAAALRRGTPADHPDAMRTAIERIEQEIANLRAIITDLRPAALDELGLEAALELLADRHRGALAVDLEVALAPLPLPAEVETTAYRLVQEALTNVVKHARAGRAAVEVLEPGGALEITVRDDGCGFTPGTPTEGFGLAGMRERVALVGGTLRIDSGSAGTELRIVLPLRAADRGRACA